MAKFSLSSTVAVSTDNLCIYGVRLHTTKYEITILDGKGNVINLDSQNVIRIKIGTDNQTPELDVNSYIDTPNGSSLTTENPTTLILDQDDLTFPPAVYDMEIIVLDDIDGDPATPIAHGIFVMQDTQLGEMAIT